MSVEYTSAIQWWWWVPLYLFVLAIGSWWGYRSTNPSLSKRQRWGLAALRGVALSLIVLAFASSEFSLNRKFTRTFRLGILVDGSESMRIHDRAGSRIGIVNDVMNSIAKRHLEAVLVGDSPVLSSQLDAWQTLQPSRLSSAREMFSFSDSLQPKQDGTIWLTDGSLVEASAIPFPNRTVWAVPVGDTVAPPNATLGEIVIPAKAIAGKPIDVVVPVSAFGKASETGSIVVECAGSRTERKVQLPPDGTTDTLHIQLTATGSGWSNLSATLHVASDSFRDDNSVSRPVFIRKARVPVTIIYSSLHPDISSIARAISADSSFQVTSLSDQRAKVVMTGIVFLVHGPDETTVSGRALADWASAYKGPLFWMPGETSSAVMLRRFSASNIGLQPVREQVTSVLLPVNDRVFSGEFPEPDWNRLPPVAFRRNAWRAERNVVAKVSASDPAMIMQSSTNRSIAMFVWDTWRWDFSPLETGRSKAVEQWWRVLAEWLESGSTVGFQVDRSQHYSRGVKGELAVVWLSPSGEPVSNATVQAIDSDQRIPLVMREPGHYSGFWTPTKSGAQRIHFEATASDGSRVVDSLEVSVDNFSSEWRTAAVRRDYLQTVASTGGRIVEVSELEHLLDSLQQLKVHDSVSYRFVWWQSLSVLIAAITLLCLEWFWRSRIGLL